MKTDERSARLRWQWTVLLSMYAGYAAFMLCRNTLIASSAAFVADSSLGIDTKAYGQLMGFHSAGAIVGKLVTGVLADIIGGRRLFLLALGLTAAANLGFALVSSFSLFALFNFLGQAFKAGGWPAMTKIIADWYEEKDFGKVWSTVSTSSRVGTILAGLLLGYCLSLMHWRWVFGVSAIITAAIVVVIYFTLKESPASVGLRSSATQEGVATRPAHAFDRLRLSQAIFEFFKSIRFWLICISIAFLTVLMDFINFIPVYLSQVLGVQPSEAAMAGSSFPMGMFAALVATAFFYDKFSKKQLIGMLGGMLALGILCVLVLWNLALLPTEIQLVVAVPTVFLFGFLISPSYYVPMSIFSINFGGRHAGFLVALIDVFGYLGAMTFNTFGGQVAQDFGWSVFIAALLVITALAFICMSSFLTLDYRSSISPS